MSLATDSKELRVLLIAPSAAPGGMEEILFNLAVCLPGAGITPEVICLQDGPLVQRLAEHDVQVEVLEAGRLREPHRFLGTIRSLAAALRARPCDAVFSDLPKAHLYAALAGGHLRVPILWCQAGHPDPPHWIDRMASALPAAGVIALSHDAVAAQRRLNPRRSVHLLHPGIDLGRFMVSDDRELRSRYGIDETATLVSLVGRLQPWKGQREFLRAAALVADSHPGARFAIVGGAILGWEGDYPQELERLAAELGIRDRVTFTGHTDEVHRWMRASNILVNASHSEGFGLVVVEAMAAGCAVVAVAASGPRDIIEHGYSGLLCEGCEPAALADAVRLLLDQPELAVKLGLSARNRAESHFSRERMAEAFAGIVRDIHSRRRWERPQRSPSVLV